MARGISKQIKTEVLYVKLPSGRGYLALNNSGMLIPLTSLKEEDFAIKARIYSLDNTDLTEQADLIKRAVEYATQHGLKELFFEAFEAIGNIKPQTDLSNRFVN